MFRINHIVFLTFLVLLWGNVCKAQSYDSLLIPPCMINGVAASSTQTGNVSIFSTHGHTSCDDIRILPNSLLIGYGDPFTYTLHFEEAVTEVTLALTGTGNGDTTEENFIFTTDGEIPSVLSDKSCYSRIVGNQIFSGKDAPPLLILGDGLLTTISRQKNGKILSYYGLGGGLFTVRSTTPFKSMTISGDGAIGHGTFLAFLSSAVKKSCKASELSPILSENVFSGDKCDPSVINLNNITPANLVDGLILSWHDEAFAKTTNRISGENVENGIYYAAFYDQKNNCFSHVTTPIQVTKGLGPAVYAGKNTTICEGDSVLFMASGASTYQWDNSLIQGTYLKLKESKTYRVVGTDAKGCSNTATWSIKVAPKTKVIAGEHHIREGESITLKAEGAKTYSWNYGLYQGAVFKPKADRLYIVNAVDENACPSSDTLKVFIEKKKEMGLDEIPLENFSSDYFKPVNIVFLLDISTSMINQEKFELLKYSVIELLNFLRPEDQISLVSFASDADVILPLSHGNDKELIKAEINKLTVSGKSAGTKGIKRGFKLAEKNYIEGGTNMVIILTDGAINQDEDDYLNVITDYRKQNILFSVVGIKNFPKDEEKMREAAQLGDGAYVPVFSYDDAKKNLILEIRQRAFKAM